MRYTFARDDGAHLPIQFRQNTAPLLLQKELATGACKNDVCSRVSGGVGGWVKTPKNILQLQKIKMSKIVSQTVEWFYFDYLDFEHLFSLVK